MKLLGLITYQCIEIKPEQIDEYDIEHITFAIIGSKEELKKIMKDK